MFSTRSWTIPGCAFSGMEIFAFTAVIYAVNGGTSPLTVQNAPLLAPSKVFYIFGKAKMRKISTVSAILKVCA